MRNSLSSTSTTPKIVSPSPLCLFAHAALPLLSPPAHHVHHALGNCFFPPPLKSHHFTRLRASVLLFIFKGLNQDKYSQVNSHRRTALCGPQKWPENLLSRHKIVSVAQQSGKNADGFERKGEESWWWDQLGSCPDWGLQQGSLSFGQRFCASKAGRRGSVKSYKNSEYNHPFKTQPG